MGVGGFRLDRADDGDDFIQEEGGLIGGRTSRSVDNVVCLAKLLTEAEADVAGGTDDENLDHLGCVIVCGWK